MSFFNADEYQDSGERLKDGWHKCKIESADLVNSKSSMAQLWKVKYETVADAKSFSDMILWTHENPQTQARFRTLFADLTVAAGVKEAASESDLSMKLAGKTVYVKVKNEVNVNTGDSYPRAKDFADINKLHRRKGKLEFKDETEAAEDTPPF